MESKIWFNDLGAFEENAVFYLMVDGKLICGGMEMV